MEHESLKRRALDAFFRALAGDEDLYRSFVLKGGLALYLLYGSPRVSEDLDLNAVAPTANVITDETERRLLEICRRLNRALSSASDGFLRLHTVGEQLSTEIPVLFGQIEFETLEGVCGEIEMQVTLSEVVCESAIHEVDGIPVHAAALEDILAEKLKALLQQLTRPTTRSRDVFDLWYFTSHRTVDAEKVRLYLIEKCKQWNLPALSRGEFLRKPILESSAVEFEEIGKQLPEGTIPLPFAEAYGQVLSFVDRMDLPE